MKQFVTAIVISVILLPQSKATDPGDSARSIQSSRTSEVMFLEFYRRSVQLFRKSFVVGTVDVEDDGFRFVPAMTSPEGFMSQERFEREFWYNPLFKELYIPFADLRSIKHNGKFTTKDKRMYLMRSRNHDYWDKIYNQIKNAMPPATGKPEKMYDKVIEVLNFPKEVAYLELYRRGSMHILNRTFASGTVEVAEEGLRFTPMTEVPPGYSRKELFDRVYWYNSLLSELYIPFSEVKSFRRKTYIRMKNGNKYILVGRPKYWNPIVNEIKTRIPR